MNEHKVRRASLKVFCGMLVGWLILVLVIRDWTWVSGFILGYGLSLVNFTLIMKICEGILRLSHPILGALFLHIGKLCIYALGFWIACVTPYFHLGGVFVGYLVLKLTIYMLAIRAKGGENIG